MLFPQFSLFNKIKQIPSLDVIQHNIKKPISFERSMHFDNMRMQKKFLDLKFSPQSDFFSFAHIGQVNLFNLLF